MLPRGPHRELRTSDCGVLGVARYFRMLGTKVQRESTRRTVSPWHKGIVDACDKAKVATRFVSSSVVIESKRSSQSRMLDRAVDKRLRSMHRMCSSS